MLKNPTCEFYIIFTLAKKEKMIKILLKPRTT